ncbi:MAG: hypothetical protein JW912_04545, partial [Sedimentisphaerales bacterium]|nr:hypothetical protein [Sedimentisphaerales bacterium]
LQACTFEPIMVTSGIHFIFDYYAGQAPGIYTLDLFDYPSFILLDTLNINISSVDPRTIYVDNDATGSNNGNDWENAYNSLQDALDVALYGDTIRVAQGTYKPSSPSQPDPREATFQLINGVAIEGGYAGFGTPDPDAKDTSVYETILSGDIGTVDDPSDNCYHVVTGSGTDPNAILDGFTITSGFANGSLPLGHGNGGGMYSEYGNPTVTDCTFTNNSATYNGGGIYNYNYDHNGNSTITNCTFNNNSADGEGGAMSNDYSSPTITYCTFSENTADFGGGMHNKGGSVTINNCVFLGNSAISRGGGMNNWAGEVNITNSRFSNNTAGLGGGIMSEGSSGDGPSFAILNMTSCLFSGNIGYSNGGGMVNGAYSDSTITSCTFIGNSSNEGGGMYNILSTPIIAACTFKDNSAVGYGGGMRNYFSSPAISSCIFWDNTSYSEGDEIYNDVYSVPVATYNNIRGGWAGEGDNNINVNPLFWDAVGHLMSNSPCRNAGDPAFVPDPGYPFDIDGDSRIIEGRVDMGADEALPPIQNISTGEIYITIQEAVNYAVPGETIVVQPGIYTGPGNWDIEFLGKAITLRSSNPNDPAIVAATIINCGNVAGHRGVYFIGEEGITSVLNGFTIANASMSSDPGGGIYCYNSSPTIKNCIIRNNTAIQGGGIYCNNSNPTIYGGTIKNNSPDGIFLEADSSIQILGTVYILSNNIIGDGNVVIVPGANFNLDDAGIFTGMSGTGTMEIDPGATATIDGYAIINLGDPYDPNTRGTIDCQGELIVKDNGQITQAIVNLTKASFKDNAYVSNSEIHINSNAPYGQVFADPNTNFTDNYIYADGDRYMDMDPSVFSGQFGNNKIYVTIKKGIGQDKGGLFECRGQNGLVSSYTYDPNNPAFCKAGAGTIPVCNLNSWTLEQLELVADAKLNLTNRFPFQPPYDYNNYNEVVYVKNLILREGAILNLSYNKLYYENLTMEPGAVITNVPLLGFSMINITMDDQTEFIVRVTHNNYTDPNEQNYNRTHINRVTGVPLDPKGVMQMSTLKDENPGSPTYQMDFNARAKGTFAKTSTSEGVAVKLEYKFTADPNNDAELVVYLSDSPVLSKNLVEVARVRAPAAGRPGSVGSNSFAVFSGLFPPDGFNFYRGTYIELKLSGSANSSCLINNWDPCVNCIGICGDFNIEIPFPLNIVDIYDYMVLLSEYGLSDPASAGRACLDIVADGCINNDDLLAWDIDEALNLCGQSASSSTSAISLKFQTFQTASVSEPLLICGKPSSGTGTQIPGSYLYNADTDGVCASGSTSTNSDGRLITDGEGTIYQINGDTGLVNLETDTVVVSTDVVSYESSQVYIGFDSGQGKLLSDAVFSPEDPNIVYIVPVQVDPQNGDCPYTAAAKLELTGGGNYNIAEIYGKNPATDPDQNNTITDCDGDLVYEPDVQHLHEIEIDSEGNLYVLSSHLANSNNWLLIYDEAAGNDSEERISLNTPNIVGPTAMVVLSAADRLYLASSTDTPSEDPNDLITEVYRFTIDKSIPGEPNLIFDDIVEVDCPKPDICTSYPGICDNELGYRCIITSMEADPVSGTLYAIGFTAPLLPDDVVMSSYPYNQPGGLFTTPILAEIGFHTSGTVEAVDIINGDLSLPFSLTWTGPLVSQEKCGGGDLNTDGTVDSEDFAVLADYWLSTNCFALNNCNGADLEPENIPDGDVDLLDLAVLCVHWLDMGCLD